MECDVVDYGWTYRRTFLRMFYWQVVDEMSAFFNISVS